VGVKEPNMRSKTVLEILPLIVLLLVTINLAMAESQQPQLHHGFGLALSSVQNAELAGATDAELSPLVDELNRALTVNLNALKESPPSSLGQVDQTLTHVQAEANSIQQSALRRTSTGTLTAYLSGAFAAVIATLLCAIGINVRGKYHARRLTQRRITLK